MVGTLPDDRAANQRRARNQIGLCGTGGVADRQPHLLAATLDVVRDRQLKWSAIISVCNTIDC